MRKKKHSKERWNNERNLILWVLTPFIFFGFFWISFILWIIWLIIWFFRVFVKIIEIKWWDDGSHNKHKLVIYILFITISLWFIFLIYPFKSAINDKFKEISNWMASYINVGFNKNNKIDITQNEMWILQKILDKTFLSSWQI